MKTTCRMKSKITQNTKREINFLYCKSKSFVLVCYHSKILYKLTKTLHTTDREMHYFYGARALNEVFYLDDFLSLEKEYSNFHFHLALDRPDPAADAAGVKYTPGFVHQVMFNTYLKDHEAPEDVEYYMCGPGPMSAAVVQMLDSLGVEPESIKYDNFGG